MDMQAIEDKYTHMGLAVFHQSDQPGKIYKPHRHGAVHIYTVKGLAKLKLDNGDWQNVEAGQEIIIQDNQLHEAVVGPDGWDYIFATTAQEARHQGLT